MPVLRIKVGHRRLSFMFRHDVYRQQTLPTLRHGRRGSAIARIGKAEVPALPEGNVFGNDRIDRGA